MKMLDQLRDTLKRLKDGDSVDDKFRAELISLLEWCHKDVTAAIKSIKSADSHYMPLLVALAQGPSKYENNRCKHDGRCTRDIGHAGWHIEQSTAQHWPP